MNTPQEQKRMHRILDNAHEMAQKKYDEPAMRMMHELVHAAVAIAGEHGRERSTIAAALGIGRETIDDRLCGKPGKHFHGSDIARMMFDPKVLGRDAHAWLLEQLMLRAGRKILMPLDRGGGDVMRDSLEVGDSVGFLHSTVLQVTDIDSDGGASITPSESRKIAAAAGGVIYETGELMTVGLVL